MVIKWYNIDATSDTTPVTISASSFYQSYAPWKLFSTLPNDVSNRWRTANNGHINAWVLIDLGVSLYMDKLRITSVSGGANLLVGVPQNYQIELSENGVQFDTVSTVESKTWTQNESRIFPFVRRKARYVKIMFNTMQTTGTSFRYLNVGKIEIGDTFESRIMLMHDSSYHYYLNSSWNSLGQNPTVAEILQYGMTSIDTAQIGEFEALYGGEWSPIQWTNGNPSLYGTLTVMPNPQILTAKNSIQLTGVESATFDWTATGGAKVALSVDDGVTYYAFKNGAWKEVTNEMSEAMSAIEYSALTWNQYALLKGESNFLKHQYYIPSESTVDDILIVAELVGTNKIANNEDFDLSYDQLTKTINIEINKSSTYFVNYVDA